MQKAQGFSLAGKYPKLAETQNTFKKSWRTAKSLKYQIKRIVSTGSNKIKTVPSMFHTITKSKSLTTVFALQFCCSPMWMKAQYFKIAYNVLCSWLQTTFSLFLTAFILATLEVMTIPYCTPCSFMSTYLFARAIYSLLKCPSLSRELLFIHQELVQKSIFR